MTDKAKRKNSEKPKRSERDIFRLSIMWLLFVACIFTFALISVWPSDNTPQCPSDMPDIQARGDMARACIYDFHGLRLPESATDFYWSSHNYRRDIEYSFRVSDEEVENWVRRSHHCHVDWDEQFNYLNTSCTSYPYNYTLILDSRDSDNWLIHITRRRYR